MHALPSNFTVDVIVLLVLVTGALLRRTIWRFSLGRFLSGPTDAANSDYDSEILAYYSAGHTLLPAGRSQLQGMRFSTFITTPAPGTGVDYTDSVAAICVLDLPFNTQTHLIGLSKEHRIDRVQFESFLKANGLVKIVLEGDFRDYFDIYAAPGQDVTVRTVLNPESMEFVVDYCRSHFWEINAAELYIVASDADKGHDSLILQSQQFVDQIKPALLPGDPGAAPVHHEAPYGEYDGPALACPICRKTMAMNDAWQACPDGHGVLLNARSLVLLHQHRLTIPADAGRTVKHHQLACPSCHNPMELVDYESDGTYISSCTHCPFRWLDALAVVAVSRQPAAPTEG